MSAERRSTEWFTLRMVVAGSTGVYKMYEGYCVTSPAAAGSNQAMLSRL
jgi:hypothetical protein